MQALLRLYSLVDLLVALQTIATDLLAISAVALTAIVEPLEEAVGIAQLSR